MLPLTAASLSHLPRSGITRGWLSAAIVVLLSHFAIGCGQSKPTGSDYKGKWEGTVESLTGNEGECHLDISAVGQSFAVKSERQTIGNCAAYEGIWTLTAEGNLKGGPMGAMLISYDKRTNQAVVSGLGRLRYLTRAPSAEALVNEASAIRLLPAINGGEASYSSSCAGGGYAITLDDLAKPSSSGNGLGFISPNLGTNGVTINGYRISLAKDATAGVTDVGTAFGTCNRSTSTPASSYFASAEPVKPGVTGTRYFATDARGGVFYSMTPIANPIVESTTVVRIQCPMCQ